jgi:ElaB/YqjD/DUF883 family membrane-anchored ribosome-binding protein
MARSAALGDAQDAFDTFREELRDTGRKAQRALRAGLKASNRQMRQTAGGAKRRFSRAHDTLGGEMQTHPLAYAAGAIAAGLAVGLLIAARRNRTLVHRTDGRRGV